MHCDARLRAGEFGIGCVALGSLERALGRSIESSQIVNARTYVSTYVRSKCVYVASVKKASTNTSTSSASKVRKQSALR